MHDARAVFHGYEIAGYYLIGQVFYRLLCQQEAVLLESQAFYIELVWIEQRLILDTYQFFAFQFFHFFIFVKSDGRHQPRRHDEVIFLAFEDYIFGIRRHG